MMRVALFFDGKNHMKALHRSAEDRWLDHGALARWVVEYVGGTKMFAAYYYTGVPGPQDDSDRHALSDLLDELERRPGFFVRRFNRRASTRDCPHCHNVIAYTEEKMVDTSLVAEMILLAVRDAYDIAVVFSGDLDIAPAVNAVHDIGKQCWVATFGDSGLSRTMIRSAWGIIDLMENIDKFSYAGLTEEAKAVPDAPDEVDAEMLRELHRAEAHFQAGGGFVGAHYFIHRWKGHHIPDGPEERRQSVQRLMNAGQVETYEVDGKTAIRSLDGDLSSDLEETREVTRDVPRDMIREMPPQSGRALHSVLADEDETVEMRLTDAMKTIRRRIAVEKRSDKT